MDRFLFGFLVYFLYLVARAVSIAMRAVLFFRGNVREMVEWVPWLVGMFAYAASPTVIWDQTTPTQARLVDGKFLVLTLNKSLFREVIPTAAVRVSSSQQINCPSVTSSHKTVTRPSQRTGTDALIICVDMEYWTEKAIKQLNVLPHKLKMQYWL